MDFEARGRVAALIRAIDETTPDADPPIMQPDEFLAQLTDACIIAGIEPATDDPVPLYRLLNRWLEDTRPAYLKQLRKDRGLTFAQVTKETGLSKRTVENWENANNPIRAAQVWNVVLLARLYDVPVIDLLY